jgi:hypothetical protein
MSRSLSYLRRGLLGIAFVGSMAFGASQALAAPQRAPQAAAYCDEWQCFMACYEIFRYGRCGWDGYCECF